MPVALGGLHVEPGDDVCHVDDIADVAALFRAVKLPMNAKLLGFDHFHRMTVAPAVALARAARASVARAGISPDVIDLVVIASADTGFVGDRAWYARLLHESGTHAALPMTVGSQECTTLLAAIELAAQAIRSGMHRRVLVLSYDQAHHDSDRVKAFGVLSDAAAACVVSGVETLDWQIRAFAQRADAAGMLGGDTFDSRKALLATTTQEVMRRAGVDIGQVFRFFSTNFFRPLTSFNAASIGVGLDRLVARPEAGHFLCADPLANAARFLEEGAPVEGELHMLQAYAPGLIASMLLERTTHERANASTDVAALVEETW